jgi:hypothetical protein
MEFYIFPVPVSMIIFESAYPSSWLNTNYDTNDGMDNHLTG